MVLRPPGRVAYVVALNEIYYRTGGNELPASSPLEPQKRLARRTDTDPLWQNCFSVLVPHAQQRLAIVILVERGQDLEGRLGKLEGVSSFMQTGVAESAAMFAPCARSPRS